MEQPTLRSIARVLIARIALVSVGCASPESPPAPIVEAVPAGIEITLTPDAHAFVVGTRGQLAVRAVDQTGREMPWRVPRQIEVSDTAVLSADSAGVVVAKRVGWSRLRVTWAGQVAVRDSMSVRVGVSSSGTVRYFTFEGGCWVIEVDARTAYEPTNLPAALKHDGLRVRFAARPSGYGSICMAGTLVELDSIFMTTR